MGGNAPCSAALSSNFSRRLLLATILLILYGSLYPWKFNREPLSGSPVLQVWYSQSYPSGALRYEDIILNVFLYVPVGLLSVMILRNLPLVVRLVLPVLLGFVLSYGVETAQVYDATRFPSLLDVIANTAGTLLGAAIALPTTGPLVRLFRWAAEHLEMSRSASAMLMILVRRPAVPIASRHRNLHRV